MSASKRDELESIIEFIWSKKSENVEGESELEDDDEKKDEKDDEEVEGTWKEMHSPFLSEKPCGQSERHLNESSGLEMRPKQSPEQMTDVSGLQETHFEASASQERQSSSHF